jgi:hypothetical protein
MRGVGVSSAGLHAASTDGAGVAIGDPVATPPLTGTFDWRTTEFELAVPPDAVTIAFGFELRGRGTLRVADIGFEAPGAGSAARPRNLDFHVGA